MMMKDRAFRLYTTPILFFLMFCLFTPLLSGCGSTGQPYSQTGFYFDTVIQITVYQAKDKAALEDCFSLCEAYEKSLSRTVRDSDVYRINHSQGRPVSVSGDTLFLLEQALQYAALSEGKVDPTVAPLMDLWNFTGEGEKEVPAKADLRECLSHTGYEKIEIVGDTVRLTDPETRLDLGFIAKGFIADKLKELLMEKGVESALINLGGNVLTLGTKPDGSSFTVGIQKPFAPEGTPAAVLSVSGKSLVSSGIYERYFKKDGTVYHHILDPSTGYPVQNGLLGVSVLSDSSMQGDALSTTCFCLGLDRGMALIESLDGVEAVFITADYELHPSGGLADAIKSETVSNVRCSIKY